MPDRQDECKCYHEYEEEHYISEFKQGVIFAKTGKLVTAERVIIGRCWGTKNAEKCNCGGDESKCDFYDYKRRKAK